MKFETDKLANAMLALGRAWQIMAGT